MKSTDEKVNDLYNFLLGIREDDIKIKPGYGYLGTLWWDVILIESGFDIGSYGVEYREFRLSYKFKEIFPENMKRIIEASLSGATRRRADRDEAERLHKMKMDNTDKMHAELFGVADE